VHYSRPPPCTGDGESGGNPSDDPDFPPPGKYTGGAIVGAIFGRDLLNCDLYSTQFYYDTATSRLRFASDI